MNEGHSGYSVAIRTLGTSGDKFRTELESLTCQTLSPERIVIYIAEGYSRPRFRSGDEEYVWVRKGMVAQRALRYEEIDSEYILMLDDDVRLAPDSCEKMLLAIREHGADCVAADSFANHRMPFLQKLRAAAGNLVFPHAGDRWAFKIHRNGSFSYLARPRKEYYASQSCGGPAMMWRKEAFLRLRMEDELWLDSLGFAYGDDMLESYKLHLNGGKLGVFYNSGIENLDAASSSGAFRKGADWMKIRTQAMLMVWWRSIYRNGADTRRSRICSSAAFSFKLLWLMCLNLMLAPFKGWKNTMEAFLAGIKSGLLAIKTSGFRSLPAYVNGNKRF